MIFFRSVGKTSLISRFVDKSYSRTSDEPNLDIFMTNLVYDGQEITLGEVYMCLKA